MKIGLQKTWSRPTPISVQADFNFELKLAYKNFKLAYNNFCVGQLQTWGLKIGLQILEVFYV